LDKEIDMMTAKEFETSVVNLWNKCQDEAWLDFETKALLVVVSTLGPVPASFTGGSLFVECTVPQAVRLETALLATMGCGIILSRVGDESAYDFV
jgi:hypothetical protein